MDERETPFEVAKGLWCLPGMVNAWLYVEDGRAVLADAGLPRGRQRIATLLKQVADGPDSLRAVLLTHGHLDHVGPAELVRRETGADVLLHPDDEPLLTDPLRGSRPERAPWRYLGYAATRRTLGALVGGGALGAPRLRRWTPLAAGDQLDHLPGRPHVVATPGHTPGHVSFVFPGVDAVMTGDALVTHDPYSGTQGPCLVARGATADSCIARESLHRLAGLDARLVLPGHGPVWSDGVTAAAHAALEARQH